MGLFKSKGCDAAFVKKKNWPLGYFTGWRMGPFLTGEDEYSPDLNKIRPQEADHANVLEAL